jgi:hypothetical protein
MLEHEEYGQMWAIAYHEDKHIYHFDMILDKKQLDMLQILLVAGGWTFKDSFFEKGMDIIMQGIERKRKNIGLKKG